MNKNETGFIDIHTHIIPAIDDGAVDIEESADMLKLAAREDITAMVATPHYLPGVNETTPDTIFQAVKELNELSVKLGTGVTIYPGNELFLYRGAFESIQSGNCLTLAQSRYILCELPMNEYPSEENLTELELLLHHEYIPILAHPERYSWLGKNMFLIHGLVEHGCLIQVTSGSLAGFFGKTVQKNVDKLMAAALIHYFSSDCHGRRGRTPFMKSIYPQLKKSQGKETADLLLYRNATNILYANTYI